MKKKQKILRAKKNANSTTNKDHFVTVGNNMAGDGNPAVATSGADVQAKTTILSKAITTKTDADNNALSATTGVTNGNDDAVDSYNAGATVVEQQYPDDVEAWKKLGFSVTEADVADLGLPGIIEGGKAEQGVLPGTAKITFNKEDTSRIYRLKETTLDPTVLANFVASNPDILHKTTCIATPKKLGVKTWFIVIGNNSAGDGPPSEPFGCITN